MKASGKSTSCAPCWAASFVRVESFWMVRSRSNTTGEACTTATLLFMEIAYPSINLGKLGRGNPAPQLGWGERLRFGRWELDFGGLAGAFGGLEVGFVAMEAGPAGEEAVGEQADVGVVGLDRIVVALAFDGDAIFGAGQFVLQAQEIFVGFELRVVFHYDEQAAQGAVELA